MPETSAQSSIHPPANKLRSNVIFVHIISNIHCFLVNQLFNFTYIQMISGGGIWAILARSRSIILHFQAIYQTN